MPAGAQEAAAATLSGRHIMHEVQQQGRQHKNQKYDVHMQIVDEKGRKRDRFFISWKKYQGAENQGLARFFRPPKLKGTALLSRSDETKDETNQWIYLPAFKSTKKLSSEDRNKSFMGSDFSNADMGGRNLDSDVHKLISGDEKYHYVESTPKSADDVYGRLEYKINRKILVPLSIHFYDRAGNLLKVLSNKKIRKHKGMYVVTGAVMENALTNSVTTLKIGEVNTDSVQGDRFFSTRGLRQ